MTSTTRWYLFSRPTELQNALKLGSPQLLMSPYHLFRFEQAGDGRCYLLLQVENQDIPAESTLIPLTSVTKQTKQSNVRVAESRLEDTGSSEEWPADAYRMSFTSEDKQGSHSGWAFPLRHGQHLLAAVGMEQVPAHTPVAWALFHIPSSMLHDVISNHLSLGRHSLRCSPAENNMHWLLVRQPEMYLFLKWKSESSVRIYHSFPESESLMTPLGYRTPLAQQTQLPSQQSLLVMDLEGNSRWLSVSNWWQPSEIIQLPPETQSQFLESLEQPIKVSVRLRYIPSETEEIPRLWRLDESQAQWTLESMILDLLPQARDALQLFVGQGQGEAQQEYWLKDNRPQITTPLLSKEVATGWLPLLPDVNLYIQAGHRLLPSLPSSVWERDLELTPQRYTVVVPPEQEAQAPVVQHFNSSDFRPLSHYIDYQLASQQVEVQKLAQATVFDILFQLEDLPLKQPKLNNKALVEKPLKELPNRPVPELSKSQPHEPKAAKSTAFRHPRGLYASIAALQRLELSIRKRKGKVSTIPPQDWLQLGRMYVDQYHQPNSQDLHWLEQAAYSLDQVFRLDRQSTTALPIEASMHNAALQLGEKSFDEEMAALDQHIQSGSSLHARFAFRYRVRKLMDDDASAEQQATLRQRFYADLAAVEPFLLVAEFYIFVEGAGLYLNDQELVARARQSYRKGLEDKSLFHKTLPCVVRN
ncbi:MAG: hypothetical protein EP343_10670 [Deltaproteobacteria bacterium]|nr:MAG: hypothetical protein EP343_10670 [Deltaproteobacteria bacterium]